MSNFLKKRIGLSRRVFLCSAFICLLFSSFHREGDQGRPPNILFVISDDQGFPHASAYGSAFVETPGFDRIASEGLLFNNVYCAVPQCSPNRASILTGRYLWQNAEAGTHASLFPADLEVFTDRFIEAGYEMGATGKTWAPGMIDQTNRVKNRDLIGKICTTGHGDEGEFWPAFQSFLQERDQDKPFFFWFGTYDPHRPYQAGEGLESGKTLEDVDVPPYLPDCEAVRSDFLDYACRIERFDSNLVKMIGLLEATGQLDQTIILVTSDNGMPFPRAKGNAYDAGVHVPMAIRWGDRVLAGREIDDLISHIDLAPTLLDAADLPIYKEIEGRSFLELLLYPDAPDRKPLRQSLFYGRERATSARPDNLGYPVRTIRTEQYQLVWNMKPERYPAGNRLHESEALAVKNEILSRREVDDRTGKMYDKTFGLRPEFELYDMDADPFGLDNLAEDQAYRKEFDELFRMLKRQLVDNKDPRLFGKGDIWESYPRFMRIRNFNGEHPAYRGVYNDYYIQPGQRIPVYLLDSEDYGAFFEKTGISRDGYIEILKSKGVVFY
jgi:uncharacterized sulfatase